AAYPAAFGIVAVAAPHTCCSRDRAVDADVVTSTVAVDQDAPAETKRAFVLSADGDLHFALRGSDLRHGNRIAAVRAFDLHGFLRAVARIGDDRDLAG